MTRPDELWSQSVTRVSTAQQGWVHLHTVVDCCTREVLAWTLALNNRPVDAIVCLDSALRMRCISGLPLTMQTTGDEPFSSHAFRERVRLEGMGQRRITQDSRDEDNRQA